ncbi:DUF4942 domain-containing protein [Vibrio breoganii]
MGIFNKKNDEQTTKQTIRLLRNTYSDHEFYPTTDEIIDIVKEHAEEQYSRSSNGFKILDVGAGDGRVLDAIAGIWHLKPGQAANNQTNIDIKKYSIEKASSLIALQSRDTFNIGTDFHHQTLLDLNVDIVFCNPPFGEYAVFAERIIRETQANDIYLVLPSRWKNNEDIQAAIKSRSGKVIALAQADFTKADRPARAIVEVLHINLRYINACNSVAVDPFELWFNTNFKVAHSDESQPHNATEETKANTALIKDEGLIKTLVQLHDAKIAKLLKNYKMLSQVDGNLLAEITPDFKKMMLESMQLKLAGIKTEYWKVLFDNLDVLTDRLTKTTRDKMIDTLTGQTSIDFTASNAHEIVLWSIRNTNWYIDDQLVEFTRKLFSKENIEFYKSNKHLADDEKWRRCNEQQAYYNFAHTSEGASHFKLALEKRIVTHRVGGLKQKDFTSGLQLSPDAKNFLSDLITIASNLGFDTGLSQLPIFDDWKDAKREAVHFHNHKTNKKDVLFEFRAFQNGNLHLFFNQELLIKLNVAMGRILGWIRSKEEASEEMDIDVNLIDEIYHAQRQFGLNEKILRLETISA